MKLLETFEIDKFYLTEGIVLLKNSKRLMKLANKLANKVNDLESEEEKKEALNYIENIKMVAEEYADIENQYSYGNKAEAKAAYNKANIKNFELIKKINNETIKKLLIGVGAYMAISVLLSGFNSLVAATGGTLSYNKEILRKLAETKNIAEKTNLLTKVAMSVSKT